jgi:hypothetical protein
MRFTDAYPKYTALANVLHRCYAEIQMLSFRKIVENRPFPELIRYNELLQANGGKFASVTALETRIREKYNNDCNKAEEVLARIREAAQVRAKD